MPSTALRCSRSVGGGPKAAGSFPGSAAAALVVRPGFALTSAFGAVSSSVKWSKDSTDFC